MPRPDAPAIERHVRGLIAREERDRDAWTEHYADDPKTPERVVIFNHRIDVLREVLAFARGEV